MVEEKKTLDDLKEVMEAKKEPKVAPKEEAAKESGVGEEKEEVVEAAPVIEVKPVIDAQGRSYATGKRKDAVARVWIKPGSGKIIVNGRDQQTYFARPVLRLVVNQPFQVSNREKQFDVHAIRLEYPA